MTNLYPWRSTTTPPIAAQDDPRYETPGGAQEKVDSHVSQTNNLADRIVTQPKIAYGAVGGNQLDPALLQNYGDIAVQGQFQVVNEQLADIAINVKSFGAIGDGESHPLSDFFPTLAIARMKYPHATSLSQEIDWAAIQGAVDYARNNPSAEVFLPHGRYMITSPIELYNGIKLRGAGYKNTFLSSGVSYNKILTWSTVSYVEFVEVCNLSFTGYGEAISNDSFVYLSTANIYNCSFELSLKECIKGNIILCKIKDNVFGYFGEINVTHRHMYIRGNYAGDTTNANVIEHNRFYGSVGNHGMEFDAGYQLLFLNNNFELNNNNVSYFNITGMFAVHFKNVNWFEKNGGTFIAKFANDSSDAIGNYIITVDGNYFIPNAETTHLFFLAGSSYLNFTNNSGTEMTGKFISYGSGEADGGIKTYYNNYFIGYEGINKFDLPATIVTAKGLSESAWLRGWTVAAPQGWSKTSLSAWSQGSNAGYIGNTIDYTTSGTINNFYYLTLPVDYFKGKKLLVRAIGTLSSGSGSALRIAYDTRPINPSEQPNYVGDYILFSTPVEIKAVLEVPVDAPELHIGLGSGGFVGTGQIIAFDIWVVEGGIEPTFSL